MGGSKTAKTSDNTSRTHNDGNSPSETGKNDTTTEVALVDKRVGRLEKTVGDLQKTFTKSFQELKALLTAKNSDQSQSDCIETDANDEPHTRHGDESNDHVHTRHGDELESGKASTSTAALYFGLDQAKGEPINVSMAESIHFLMRNQIDMKKFGEVLDSYETPENCPSLQVTKLNDEVAEKITNSDKGMDNKLTNKVQKPLLKGIIALTHAIPTLADSDDEAKSSIEDAITLLCHANFQLNEARKEILKSALPDDFKKLGKRNPTSLLYGDDVPKQLKEVKEVKRAVATTAFRSRGFGSFGRPNRSYHPYAGQYTGGSTSSVPRGGQRRPSFLGQRYRPAGRGRGKPSQ